LLRFAQLVLELHKRAELAGETSGATAYRMCSAIFVMDRIAAANAVLHLIDKQ